MVDGSCASLDSLRQHAEMSSSVGFRPAPTDTERYDELAFLPEVASELGVAWSGRPVERVAIELRSGQRLSALRWGTEEPEVVLLHGGGQNAHTWDSVLVAWDRPALAIDLPGHGHSDRRTDGDVGPWRNAEAVAEMIEALAPAATVVVGMSLGGATTIRLAAERPDLVGRAVIVDVTPQVNEPGRTMTPEQRGSVALVGGAPSFASFEEVVEITLALSPNRTEAGIRRGVRHNTFRDEDGRWRWRYELGGHGADEEALAWTDFTPLWDDVARLEAPTMLVCGGSSAFVRAEDVEQLCAHCPTARIEVVEGSGHAVQSDQPLALVALLDDFADAN